MPKDKKKILLIEDDLMISGMYKKKLDQDGFEVLVANNGSDGLDMAKSEKPDLILLDIIMPQLDGFTVLEEIKKIDKLNKVPVIMLTNLGTDEDKEKGKKLGANGYLIKSSMTPTQMAQEVTKNLNK